MKGVYLEPVEAAAWPPVLEELLPGAEIRAAARFCEESEGVSRKYHVYRVETREGGYVLKRSDRREREIYEKLLAGRGFPVPACFGAAEQAGGTWLLLELIEGADLREYSPELADACAESLARISNPYWCDREEEFTSGVPERRMERYLERVERRARCLGGEEELRAAYALFLERQRRCPRTLSNGDFLPCNAICRRGEVILIDWGFGGTMPYSLDVARMIAHATPEGRTFPFHMRLEEKRRFVEAYYRRLRRPPEWERYLLDVKLAVLNEWVEFIEEELLHPEEERDSAFEYYYTHAKALARELLA